MGAALTDSPDILFERRGTAGIVTLNRPRALNALTHGMVRALDAQLRAWRADGAVTRVVVTAAGERAFCAGGDIRHLYQLGRDGRRDEALAFWREEYVLNTLIKLYPKPYVSLIDGIVMGGGVGISVHGSHRVAGDRFVFAMPEVGIGLYPDIGATWFLPRLPGELGTFCALTGERLAAEDGVLGGVATHRVASDRLADLLDALTGATPVDAIIAAFAQPAGQGPVAARRSTIDRLFAGDRIEDILDALDREAGQEANQEAEWARAMAATIRGKAPLSLKVTLAQLRKGRHWSFEDCMRAEMRLTTHFAGGQDFYEGVRAVIIDKDNAPRWQPARLDDVSDAEVERHFAPIADELDLRQVAS